MMKDWFGKVVDREDLTRHDKWCCMMMPRLKLLRELLADDGAIFIMIDDNEVHRLRFLMDEVFGEENFVATVIWEKVYSPKSSAKYFSENHDFIVIYARSKEYFRPVLLPRTDEANARYSNPDDDPRGPWKPSDLSARNPYSKGVYSIQCPGGRMIDGPPSGNYWRYSREKFWELDKNNRIWWGRDQNQVPAIKRFLSEVKQGLVPETIWTYQEVDHTQAARKGVLQVFPEAPPTFTTKPVDLLKRIVRLSTDKKSIVLDSFAGSGTTAHAVLALNKEDGGNRRFVLIECEDYADTYLDRQERLFFWYRNRARKDYYVQGWKRGRIYADFVVTLQSDEPDADDAFHRVYVLETKGMHLKHAEDTEYKRSVFDLCTEHARKKDWAEFVPAMRDRVMRVKVVDEDEWQQELNAVLGGQAVGGEIRYLR